MASLVKVHQSARLSQLHPPQVCLWSPQAHMQASRNSGDALWVMVIAITAPLGRRSGRGMSEAWEGYMSYLKPKFSPYRNIACRVILTTLVTKPTTMNTNIMLCVRVCEGEGVHLCVCVCVCVCVTCYLTMHRGLVTQPVLGGTWTGL